MKTLIISVLSFICLFSFTKVVAAEKKVALVTGGHKFEREPFFFMFDSFKDIDYTEIVHEKDKLTFTREKMGDFDVMVLYDMHTPKKYDSLTVAEKTFIKNFLESGRGLVVLHHAMASYPDWDEYEQIIGGRYHLESYKRNGKEFPGSTYKHDLKLVVEIMDSKHPVTKGMGDFVIHDEAYGQFSVGPDVHPLLATDHPESGKIIAWTTTYANGRVAVIQLGHDHYAYENPSYRQLVQQAIRWVNE
jgi:hypothetical protein